MPDPLNRNKLCGRRSSAAPNRVNTDIPKAEWDRESLKATGHSQDGKESGEIISP